LSSCGDGEKKDGFSVSGPRLLARSLQRMLVPVVDKVRDLNTRLGMRPYRVRVVRTTWGSGERGVGVEVVVSEMELLPTPLLVDMNTLSEEVTAVGRVEVGTVTLREVSGRYTEDHLTGVDSEGNPVGDSDSLYYEVDMFRPDGQPGERRRFALASVPFYDAPRAQWVVTLDAQLARRGRDGSPA